jgi:phosphatidylglycerol:prolipoprotein diacylglycerol transferase
VFDWNLPFLGRPILWYGVLFALGFFLGYLVLSYLLRVAIGSKKTASLIAEKFLLFAGVGAIAGARLADVFFYQNPRVWQENPFEIFYVWEGGLSSHGAAVGVLIALYVLKNHLRKFHLANFSFLNVLDFTVIPASIAGACIRIGNFINQEILGTPTNLPWGIMFLHPADGGAIVPRHPVQLYECVSYLVLFFFLFWLFKSRHLYKKAGRISGWFLVLCFGSRFFIEYFKVEQSALIAYGFPLTMGQILSIPLVVLGVYLLMRGIKGKEA